MGRLYSSLLLLAACNSAPLIQPPEDLILETFGITQETAAPTAEKSQYPVHVFFDASASMAGFARCPDSTYSRVVKGLLDGLATANYSAEVSKFSEGIEPVRGNASREVLYPAFYSGSSTTLGKILNQIGEEKLADHITVVVSDFVHSAGGEDQLQLPRAIRGLVEHAPAAALLAFRSGFKGHYWPSTHPRSSNEPYQLDVDDGGPRGRPFYFLVLAPSPAALTSFRDYVLESLRAEASFEPERPAIVFETADFAPDYRAGLPWNRYGPFQLRKNGESIRRLVAYFLERETPRQDINELRLSFGVRLETPLRAVEKLGLEVSRARFRAGALLSEPEPIVLAPTIRFGEDGGKLVISYPFPRPEAGTWDAYRVRIRAGEGNALGPHWVTEWTTPDDRAPLQANRTLNLDLLVEAMARQVTEQVVCSDQIFVLGRGE